jgi:hypothetical protein
MTLAGRLEKIETRLTPKQGVLLWLKEKQGAFKDFKEWTAFETSTDVLRRTVENVGKGVRDSLKFSKKEEEIARIELGARNQTKFLSTLPLVLNWEASTDGSKDWLLIQLLQEQHRAMAAELKAQGSFECDGWKWWRKTLVALLRRLWRQQAIVEAISARYFDQSPVLFCKQEQELKESIGSGEFLVQLYNFNKPRDRHLPAIDLKAQWRSAEQELPGEVRRFLRRVKSMCL